jgi:hypothetical protein
MMVEVARLGHPLFVYPLPVQPSRVTALRRGLAARLQPPADVRVSPLLAGIGNWLYDHGVVLHSRDFDDLHRALTDRGLATMLKGGSPAPATAPPDELPQVTARIRGLLSTS